jgi:ABC-type Fe3+-siderophore transport system permease subunit
MKKRMRRAIKRSLLVASIIPALAALVYLVALAPAPIAFGAILGLVAFPFFYFFAR